MAMLDWSECPLVKVIPGKVSGAPLLKNTRLPVDAITGNYDAFRDEGLSEDAAIAKLWIATRKLASTPSRLFSSIAPGINSKLARSLPQHEIHTVVSMKWGGIKTALCSS